MLDRHRLSYRALARSGLIVLALVGLCTLALAEGPKVRAGNQGTERSVNHKSDAAHAENDTKAPPPVLKDQIATQPKEAKAPEESQKKKSGGIDWPTWIDAFSALATGIFTGVLGIFTIGLWGQTKRLAGVAEEQSRDIKASIVAATRSADVAEKALVKLEVPHIYPVDLKYFIDSKTGVNGACFEAKFKNYGRAPAVMKYARLRAIVSPPDDLQTTLAVADKKFPLFGMVGDRDISDVISLGPEPAFLAYTHAISTGKMNLNLLVRVDWGDVFDNGASSSTWFVWDWRANKFVYGVQPPPDN